MVTEVDVLRELRRLATIYAAPDTKDETSLVETWRFVFEGVSERVFREAVARYVRSDARFFPKPGQVLKIARAVEAESFGSGADVAASSDWNQLQEGPCPVCGAVLQLVVDPVAEKAVWDHKTGSLRNRTPEDPPATKRYGVIHDSEAHRYDGAPIVGMSNAR